jgi:Ca2+-binding RTX toxin-like protein
MPKTLLETWYDFALLQIAAESYLEGINWDDPDDVLPRLMLGNNDLREDVYVNGDLETNQLFGRFPEEENTDVLPGATRLTATQADYVFSNWRIVDHHANDPSGFSATLLENRATGEYTLSFRSTEFKPQIQGGDHERDMAGANVDIISEGFAYAQLSAMERYYRQLSAEGGPLEGKSFNVTGYSLGAHLATVFTEIHWNSVTHTYLFNGAGRGTLTGGIASIAQLIEAYDALVADPEAAFSRGLIPASDRYRYVGAGAVTDRFENALAAANIDWTGSGNAYLSPRHGWATYVLDAYTDGSLATSILSTGGISPLAEQKITYLYGMGSHGDQTLVTNSGLTPGSLDDKKRIFIEDQPERYGDLSDVANGTVVRDGEWGRTHSITLVVDSLATIDLFQKVDPTLSQHQVETILAASSNQRASVIDASYLAGVEGNSLENAIDSLARILLGANAPGLGYDSTPDGFGNLDNREAFYSRIQELKGSIASRVVPPLKLIPFGTMEWEQVLGIFTITSFNTVPGAIDPDLLYTFATNPDDPEAIAYRYALRELNPFVLFGGADLYAPFNDNGELDLYDPETGKGLTEEFLRARAWMLAETFERNVNDKGYAAGEAGENVLFDDRRVIGAVPVFENPLGIEAALQNRLSGLTNDARDRVFVEAAETGVKGGATKLIAFGRDLNRDGEGVQDEIIGGGAEDQLFGLAGDDILEGKDKNDYLEGGAGADLLIGGAGEDELFGLDHQEDDRLRGGEGYDTYYADLGDVIRDGVADGETHSGIVYVGQDLVQLTDGNRAERESFFTSSDGRFVYWESGTGEVLVYDARGGDTPLRIEAPTAAVSGRETITLADGTTADISGRPDLGIQLMTIKDPRPRVEPIPSRLSTLFNQARNWRERADPLALDLGAKGIQAVGDLGDSTVLFDMDGNGVRNGTGWLTGEDAWVVIDRDGDGLITTGAELFGIDTLLPNGQKAVDGFAALAPLDTNADGKVDAADAPLDAWQVVRDIDDDGFVAPGEKRAAEFSDLLLWRDTNVNGISEPFELATLTDAGVESVSLGKYLWGQSIGGENRALYRGIYTRSDGTFGDAYALDLARETFYREYSTPPVYDPSIAALPGMRGAGRVRDLQEAAAASPGLRELLAQVAALPTRAEQWAAIDEVLQKWVATSDMPDGSGAAAARANAPVLRYTFAAGRLGPLDDITPGSVAEAYLAASGGAPIAPTALPIGWFEAQQSAEYRARVAKLTVIERFMGQTWAQVPQLTSQVAHTATFPGALPTDPQTEIKVYAIDAGMNDGQWALLDLAYTGLKEAVYGAIASQTRLLPYLEAATVAAGTRDFSGIEAMLAAKRAANPAEGLSDAVELGRYLGVELIERGWHNLPFFIEQWVREAAADATLAAVLTDLRVKIRNDLYMSGTQLGDTLIGSAWTPNYWTTASPTIWGEDGNDVILGGLHDYYIHGGPGRDVIYGGAGTEVMYGGAGRDVFVFGRGSGRDEAGPEYTQLVNGQWFIPEGDRDILALLPGVAPEDVQVRRGPFWHNPGVSWGLMELTIVGTGDVFLDSSFFSGDRTDSGGRSIEEVRFADGTVWDVATLRLKGIEGTEEDDRYHNGSIGLRGYDDSDDVIDGRAGDDILEGVGGRDTLIGGPGKDVLSGGAAEDDLAGGEGDDILRGGTGVDRLDGGPGDDTLTPGVGVDVIVFGRDSGRDTISDPDQDFYYGVGMTFADMDVVELAPDVAPGDVRLLNAPDALRVSIVGSTAQLVDVNFWRAPVGVTSGIFTSDFATIRELRFDDGTVWDLAYLQRESVLGTEGADSIRGFDELADVLEGRGGDDTLSGYAGQDVVRGGAGDDWLDGGTGDDRLEGGPGVDRLLGGLGRDTYVWTRGGGGEWIQRPPYGYSLSEDVVEVGSGLGLAGLVVYRTPSTYYDPTLVIGDPDTDEWLAVGIDFALPLSASLLPALQFAAAEDAWTWTTALGLLQAPTESADVLHYTGFGDAVSALGGDDSIDLGAGNDSVDGGAGSDTLLGGAGDDSLYGGSGGDTLTGGTGADELLGGIGGDLYLFQSGFGQDTIYDGGIATDVDVVRFLDVASTAVRAAREAISGTTYDVLTVTATGDRIVFDIGAREIERFEFADGVHAHPVRPLGSLSGARARENEPFAYVVPATAFADLDGLDTLTYSAALQGGGGLPTGLAFDPATRTISGTPSGVTPGYASLVITATDPLGFSASQTLSALLLGPNTAPTAQTIANQAVLEDASLSFLAPAGTFTEADPFDVLTYTARLADGSALPAWLGIDRTSGRLSGTPRNEHVGSIDVRLTATDYSNASATADFTLTVVNTNDAPLVTAATLAQRVQAGTLPDFAGPSFVDPDVGDALTLTAQLAGGAALPGWLVFDPITGRFSGAPGAGDVARMTVEVAATDLAGARRASSFGLQVDATDGTWRTEDDAFAVVEDTPLVLAPDAVLANDKGGDADRPLAIVAVGKAVNGTVALDGAGDVVFTPAADFNGAASFEYTAEDDVGGRAVGRVTVTVTPVNDAPRAGVPIPVQSVTEGQYFYFTLPPGALVDPDPGDTVTSYAASLVNGSPLPAWLSFDGGSRLFQGVPGHLDGGPLALRVTGTDRAGAKGYTDFSLDVVLTSIVGTPGDDVLSGTATADRMYGLAGSDRLDGGAGGDQMYGGSGDDAYVVDSAGDFVSELAGEGRDRVESSVSFALPANVEDLVLTGAANLNGTGNALANTITGNAGANQLAGSLGDDVYVFGHGGGADTVSEFDSTAGNIDRVRFLPGVAPDGVALQRVDSNLVLNLNGSSDRLTLSNWFSGGAYQIELVEFDDGTTWGASFLATAPRYGTPGQNDVIYGTTAGDDAYLFGRGFGQDAIYENYYTLTPPGNDTLIFTPDVAPADVALKRIDLDLLLSIAGTSDRVTLKNWFNGTAYQVEQVVFADGTVWGASFLATAPRYGEPTQNDTILGTSAGDDYYLFGPGFGQDTIHENYYTLVPAGNDTLTFAPGAAPGDVRLRRADNDLMLSLDGTSDRVTLKNWFNGTAYRIEQVVFADGTLWGENFLATAPRHGEPGQNDTIIGNSAGDDYYLFGPGFGQDTIHENYYALAPAGNDTLTFTPGVAPGDVRLRRADGDLVLSIDGTSDRVTLKSWFSSATYQIEQVAFTDGTVWGASFLATAPRYGEPGQNDTISVATAGDDYFLFGRGFGRDTIYENQYGFTSPSNDTLAFTPEVAPSDVRLRRVDFDLELGIIGTSDRVTLKNWFNGTLYQVEQVVFADGTVWGTSFLATAPRYGEPGQNDTISVATPGDDYFLFGRGFGQDTIYENQYGFTSPSNDTVLIEPDVQSRDVRLSRSGADLALAIDGTSDTLTLKNWFASPLYRIEQVVFADGRTWNTHYLENLGVIANNPPVLDAGIADQGAAEDAPFSFAVPASAFREPDSWDALAYTARRAGGGALPAWLAFDPATRTFSGTPTNGDVGAIDVEVLATDDSGAQVSDTFSLTVTNTNDAPVPAEAIAEQRVAAGETLAFTVPATAFADPDIGDILAYAAAPAGGGALPSWLGFDPGTRTFSGTPTNADVGEIQLEVTATDLGGASASGTFRLTVAHTNTAPVATGVLAPQTTPEGAPFAYALPDGFFTDADAGDTLTLSARRAGGATLPGWLAFDPAGGAFSGTPDDGDVGALAIEIVATDAGGAAAAAILDLDVVDTPEAPQPAQPLVPQTALEDEAWSLAVPVDAFVDPDTGDVLAYSASRADGSALPAWLTFDEVAPRFHGTPSNGDVGAVVLAVVATDTAGLSAMTAFSLTVANTNDAPTVDGTLARQRADEDTPFAYALPTDLFSDEDAADSLTLAARLASGAALPAWLAFDPAAGLFAGTPSDADLQNLTVEIVATDSAGASATATLEIEVANTPDAPLLAQPPAPQTALEDEEWTLGVPADAFVDPDAGDVLTYSAALADGSALPGWLAFDGFFARFRGTPANEDVGSLAIRLTATDTAGLSAETTIALTVVNTPDAPVLAEPIADQGADEDAPFSFTVPATAFADPDAGDALAYTAALAGGGALPAWLAFDSAARTFSGTPGNADVGDLQIEVRAIDTTFRHAPDTFTLTVANTNDAPTVSGTLARQRADEDAAFAYALPGDLFSDEDAGDTLTLAARLASGAALPAWLAFDPAGLFGGTPSDADLQNLTVEVIATDSGGATATATLEIEVANAPDAPVLVQPPAPQTAYEDEEWSLGVPADAFIDPDAGDVLTYSAAQADGSALPGWLEFDAFFARFRGTPGSGDVGTVELAVTATDTTGLSAVANVTLIVVNTPDAPVLLAGIPDQTGAEHEWFGYWGALDQFADDDLVHGDALALTASLAGGDPLPGWLTFDPWSFSFTGVPGRGDAGTLTIEVTAMDTTLRAVTDSFTLAIAEAEAVPVTPSDDWAWTAEDAVLEFPATDLVWNDGAEPWWLQVVAVGNAEHGTVSLDDVTGLVTFLPAQDFNGTASFEYTVSDGEGSGTATVWVEVWPENDAPVFVGELPQVDAAAREAFELALPADAFSDVDEGDSLWYWLEGDVPWWLQFDSSTLTLSGVPDNVGTFRVVLTAMDSYGATANGEFELVVGPGGPIVGTELADSLYGTDAADTLIGLDGDDWLDGGVGPDEMRGGPGHDTYSVDDPGDAIVEAPLQGHDTVYVYSNTGGYALPDGVEDVYFFVCEPVHGVGNERGNLLYGGEGADLLEGLGGADSLYGNSGDDELRGGAGRDSLQDWQGDDVLRGGDGDDSLSGGEGADVLDGGPGRDWLDGGPGRDVYLLERGGDRDEIYEWDAAEVNVIRVGDDLSPADLIVRNPWGWMLTIGVRDTNDVVAIGLWPFDVGAPVPFAVELADGTVWDGATLAELAAAGAVEDAAGDGTEEGDYFAGTPGTDQFFGAGGDDVLNGGGGDDWLYGDAGDDAIDGGAGDDSMTGGDGSDTYLFGRGSGHDYLYDGGWEQAETDSLALDAGIAPRDVVLRGDSWSRSLELIGSSDLVMFDVTVEQIAFADGTVWDETDIALRLVWDQWANPILGTADAELLEGTSNSDELHGFEGDDVLDPGDGPWWGASDTLLGGEGDDTYFLRAGIGQDTILDLAGDADRIEVSGFLPADVRVERSIDGDLRLVVDATGDSLVVRGFLLTASARIEEVRFADGTAWRAGDLDAWGSAATEADDVLVGASGGDLFDGLGGHDQLYGLGGDDALFGGDGFDSLWGGDGADLIDGGADDDTLLGGAGDDLLRGGAGADQVLDYDGGADVLEGGEGNDGLDASAGRALLAGGAGDDQLYLWGGEPGAFAGGTGDDQLIYGSDALLLVNRGDGSDSAYADAYRAPRAALSLGGGIAYEDVALEESGGSLVVHLGNGERLVLDRWYDDPAAQVVEQLQFIAEAMAGYDPAGADALRDQKIERFDFKAVVAAFDAVRGDAVAAQWSAMEALLAAHLGGSDTEALGGDLAYRYGLAGSFAEIGKSAAQSIIAEPGFAAAPQALRPAGELAADPVKLG